MSFIYSQALVEASSLGKCLDTEPSVLSSGNHTHKLSLWHDKTMEPSRLSRFGMTCKPLTESLGAELLTLWLEDSRAKTYPLPEKALELTESAAECGSTWRVSLAKFDPDTCSWKTVQLSLLGDSESSSVTWPEWGMTANGECYQQPTPFGVLNIRARITSAIDSGFVQRWPTPTVCGNYNRKGASKTSGDGLATAVRRYPTPTAHNAKETNAPSESARNTPTLAAQVGGALNPDWVEWLMGWPIGHTDLKRSEMVKSLSVQQQPSDFLLEVCE